MKVLKNFDHVVGGAVHKLDVSFYILSPGDTLKTPDFEVHYPELGVNYVLNGNSIACTKEKADNTWTEPSALSESYFSKNTLSVQTDENFLYVEITSLVPHIA